MNGLYDLPDLLQTASDRLSSDSVLASKKAIALSPAVACAWIVKGGWLPVGLCANVATLLFTTRRQLFALVSLEADKHLPPQSWLSPIRKWLDRSAERHVQFRAG